MKKIITALGLAVLVGCAPFSTNTFRTEQTLTQVAYGSYVAYTQAVYSGVLKVSPDQSNSVKVARLKFAASVGALEAWRSSYETNSAVKPQAEAALSAVTENSSNLVWTIHYLLSQ